MKNRTEQLRKQLDIFKKNVSIDGHISEKFNKEIEKRKCAVAKMSGEERPITATCNVCEYEIGISKFPTDICPVCDAAVVACNECKMDDCYGCEQGSKFENWNTMVDYLLTYTVKRKRKQETIKAHNEDEAVCILTDRDGTHWHDIRGTAKRINSEIKRGAE